MSPSIRAAAPRPTKSATRATVLSFLWPGLGQAYLGRPRAAIVFAVPAFFLLAVLAWQARDGLDLLFARVLLVPAASVVLVVATILLGIWRTASMAAAATDGRTTSARTSVRGGSEAAASARRRTSRVLGLLVVLVVATHGLVVWTGLAFLDAASRIYVTGGDQGRNEADGVSRPTPWATPLEGERINVLLIGADSGLGYPHALTDTMIVVSVDPKAKHVDMISFPRDIARFELYSGGTYNEKLNSLATYANEHRDKFPDGGVGTLAREIGYLIGAPIHYYAFINLAGFRDVIDAVGGIDIVNAKEISDASYQFPDGKVGFHLTEGPHHLDGRTALAYVRSRYGPGDNDFTRARRQQELLVALRQKLTSPSMVPQLPSVLNAFAAAVQTDYPAEGVPDLLALAKQIPSSEVSHYVLGPPYATRPAKDTGTYILVIDEKKFATLSINLFGTASRYAREDASGAPSR